MLKKLIIYMFLICLLLFSIQSISAANITVHPGESIQNAVNGASDGDNITVYDNNNNPYTYKESISLNKKITIKTSGNVTVEAKNSSSAVFTVNSGGSGSSIQNFILTKSSYCIMINNANSCNIANNVISGASLVGIQFYGNIYNSKVTNNTITGSDPSVGNGISFEYGTVTNNTITGNNITNFLNGIIFNNNSENNTVSNNRISCTGNNGVGIYTTDNARDMNITGNTVTGAEDGIAIQQIGTNTPVHFNISWNNLTGNKNGFWIYLSNSTIYSNTASGNLVSGLDITGRYNQIINNTALNNGNCGITLGKYSDADYNIVDGNILNYNQAGINSASYYSNITGNWLSNNANYGVIITASHVKLANNTVLYNDDGGILLIGTYNIVDFNKVKNNPIGIVLQSSGTADYNWVVNNILNYNNNGINSGSPYSYFINNTINNCLENGLVNTANHVNITGNSVGYNNGTGILSIGTYNLIKDNVLTNNCVGICLQKSTNGDYNSVTGNSINYNGNGINSGSPCTELNNNTVNNNVENGIVNTASNVNIQGNTVLNNGGTGILCVGSYINIFNNVLTGNNLGIYLQSFTNNDYNVLTNNTASYNFNGINSGSNVTNFYNNTLNYNNQTGLTVTGSNCYVVGNSMCYNKEAGLTITGTNNVVIMNRLEQNLYGASFSNYNAAIFCFNSVVGNIYQLYSPDTSGTMNAIDNWWGSNSTPNRVYGLFNVNPWIVLKVVPSFNKINVGEVSNITADLTWNSAGEDTDLIYPDVFVPDGILVNFSCDSLGFLSSLVLNTVNGSATTSFTGKSNGSSTILATVNDQKVSTTVTVLGVTNLSVNSASGHKGDVVTLVATLQDGNNQPATGKTIRFLVDGNLVGTAITNSSGVATFSYTLTQDPGSYTIVTQFSGDGVYSACNGTGSLIVSSSLITTNITLKPISGYNGDGVNFTAALHDTDGNPITGKTVVFYINGTSIGSASTDSNGSATFVYTLTQPVGSYIIMAIFLQEGNYLTCNSTSSLQVNPKPTSISTNPITSYKGDKINLTATLKDNNGNPISGQTINFYINGTPIGTGTTNINGTAYYQYTLTQTIGNYTVLASFNQDGVYAGSNATNSLEINLIPTKMTLNPVTDYNGDTVNLTASLTDDNGLAIAGKIVYYSINGASVGSTSTDTNGIATLVYKVSQLSKNCNLLVKFLGDDDYSESVNTEILDVVPEKTYISVLPVSSYSGIKTSLKATLKDEEGSVLSGKLINFFVNGYLIGTATTNSDGIANMIYALDSCGTYNLSASFNEDVGYSSSSDFNSWIVGMIPSKLIVKSLKSYKGDKLNLTATLINTVNNTAVSGRAVYFYVNGKFVGSGVTSSTGIASYIYVVKEVGGCYCLRTEYKQDNLFKSSCYNTTLTIQKTPTKTLTNTASGKKNSRVKLTATVTNLHTNTKLGNATVKFYVSGKYVGQATTNKYGIASFYYTAKLNKGTYTIITKYLMNNTYNGSSSSNKLKIS